MLRARRNLPMAERINEETIDGGAFWIEVWQDPEDLKWTGYRWDKETQAATDDNGPVDSRDALIAYLMTDDD
jgi:hypothetical protein